MDNSSAVNVARSGEDDDAHRRWAAVGTAAGGAKASVAAGRAASVMAAVRDFMVTVFDYYEMWIVCQATKKIGSGGSGFGFFHFNVELEAVGGKIQDWRQNSGQRSGIYHYLSLRNVGDDNLLRVGNRMEHPLLRILNVS